MNVKLLTEYHLEFLSLTRGCRGLSESTLVKMSNCWKSNAGAQMIFNQWKIMFIDIYQSVLTYCAYCTTLCLHYNLYLSPSIHLLEVSEIVHNS